MRKLWITLVLAFLQSAFLILCRSQLSPSGTNYEVQALVAVKASLIDPQNYLSGWDIGSSDPCSWHYVSCNAELFVTNLQLGTIHLSGTLSPSVGNLSKLQSLGLTNNNIWGNIPEEIAQLTELTTLELSNNQFDGQIPSSMGLLKNLQTLRLEGNKLSGPFPTSLASITHLLIVDVSFNNLSGQVPHLSADTIRVEGNANLCGYATGRNCSGQSPSLPFNAAKGVKCGSRQTRAILIAAIVTPLLTVSVVAVFIFIWFKKRACTELNQKHLPDPEVCLGQLKKYSLREMHQATDRFNTRNLLGRGGFGHVYKGRLWDGSMVAVKRLRDRHATGQFKAEVEMVSHAVHRHLLRLIGYCVTSNELLLVYPFMPNGSVASRLRDKPALDWRTRRRIAIGAARGLFYLHEQCDPKIIHRDVKAANILLDEEFEAVVGDFGLAKILDHEDSHVTTAVRGTVGHIAPECLATGQSSEKTDVYGFGILLLELITGRRAIDFGRLSSQKGLGLLDWVKKLKEEGRLEGLVDEEMRVVGYEVKELEDMVQVALVCTQFRPADRPNMGEVARMLEEGDGLAEKWEACERANEQQQGPPRYLDVLQETSLVTNEQQQGPPRYLDVLQETSLVTKELELSGPR